EDGTQTRLCVFQRQLIKHEVTPWPGQSLLSRLPARSQLLRSPRRARPKRAVADSPPVSSAVWPPERSSAALSARPTDTTAGRITPAAPTTLTSRATTITDRAAIGTGSDSGTATAGAGGGFRSARKVCVRFALIDCSTV